MGILNCRRLLKIPYDIAMNRMRWLTNFYDFRLNWTATAAIGIYPDCHRWWISKMQSDILKNDMNQASVFEWYKRFKEGRESLRNVERCGRSKEVNTAELAKGLGLGLGLLCWGIKGVQQEIPSEEASNLQIRSVAFPSGQCTSPQLHPCHTLFGQDGHQDTSSPSL